MSSHDIQSIGEILREMLEDGELAKIECQCERGSMKMIPMVGVCSWCGQLFEDCRCQERKRRLQQYRQAYPRKAKTRGQAGSGRRHSNKIKRESY